jgi:3-oxoacyl-[acyl-carrier protein] reductase
VGVHYGRSRDKAEQVAASLAGDGHVVVGAELADPDAVRAMVDGAAEALGAIDVLVNNAGVYLPHPIGETSYEEWQRAWRETLDVNLVAVANATWCALRHMGRGGRIVNVGSRGAFRGDPDHSGYAAAKGGLTSFGQTLARELGPRGIAVMTVAPGFVETDMTADYLGGPEGDAIRAQSPLGRIATADEVAAAIHFLASPQAEMASGSVIDVNGASYLRM